MLKLRVDDMLAGNIGQVLGGRVDYVLVHTGERLLAMRGVAYHTPVHACSEGVLWVLS